MKITYRIPTNDPYAYVGVEEDGIFTTDTIVARYNELTREFKPKSGLTEKEFNRIIDRYLWGDGHMAADEFAAMSPDQQAFIQIIKRSKKRQ